MTILLLLGGIALLSIGAEGVVRRSANLPRALHVRPLVIGLTVVAIGSSTPELVVGITASLDGHGELAVGNIAGANAINILLILGASALFLPMPLHLGILRMELPAMVLAAVALYVLALDGVLEQLDGALLLVAAVVYTAVLIRRTRAESREVQAEFAARYGGSRWSAIQSLDALMLVGGIALTLLGADWLVVGAQAAARALGVSDAVIGLTVVSIGTTAPEIVISVLGTIRGERDVAIGNLIGSSFYNIAVILGITSVASAGIPVSAELRAFDLPIMIAIAALCVPVFITGRRVSRVEGALMVAAYVAYVVWILAART